MKRILLICLLAGHTLLAYAEENVANNLVASSDHSMLVNEIFPFVSEDPAPGVEHDTPALPDTRGDQESHPEGGTSASGSELWTGLKLERDLQNLKPLKTGPAPRLHSAIALIYDQETQRPLYTKNANERASIASITKLMTAMVVLDALLPLSELISIESSDIDRIKRTPSRLGVGMTFTRSEMMSLALMSSENRAALALARTYPGGTVALVEAMNAKARELGMEHTRFVDPAGLNSGNVSTAQDLVKMVAAARRYSLIHQYTTASSNSVDGLGGRVMRFINTNPLVRNVGWNIGISKTGFINEAGRCLVMEAVINQRSVIIVLLNSWGKRTRIGDANRIKRWMESADTRSRASRRS